MEYLAMLPEGDAAAARRACGRILQEASPRLVVCGGAPPQPRPPAGVRLIETREDLAGLAAALTEQERWFVEAWLLGKAEAGKQRPGEGRDWDAPPFEAP
jgi:hypothetical protein